MAGQVAAITNRLPDGRVIRALDGTYRQMDMFKLHSSGLFVPANESIMSIKEHDRSIQSGAYRAVNVTDWWRADEYGFYHRNQNAPFGTELVWIENGVRFKNIIPDVAVQFNRKEISLQKVTGGLGIYRSIGLLKIEQTDEKEFTVSPIDLADLAGKVRAMNFIRNGYAKPDEFGFPDGNTPMSFDNPDARYNVARTDFDEKATGWHGSLARIVDGYVDWDRRRGVFANGGWYVKSGVAVISRESPVSGSVTGTTLANITIVRDSNKLIVEGTPEQLDAAVRLLEQLKQ